MINSPLFLLATGLSAGLTAALVGVAASDLFGTPQTVAIWLGLGICSAVGAAFILAAKKWMEGQVRKLIEYPPKEEIFRAIQASADHASGQHHQVMLEINGLNTKVEEFKKEMRPVAESVIRIQARHDSDDRHDRKRRQADTGEIKRP